MTVISENQVKLNEICSFILFKFLSRSCVVVSQLLADWLFSVIFTQIRFERPPFSGSENNIYRILPSSLGFANAGSQQVCDYMHDLCVCVCVSLLPILILIM